MCSATACAWIADVATKLGRLDILVNNAGLFAVGTVDATLDAHAFDHQQTINVTGVIASIRAASRIRGDGGHTISMTTFLYAAMRVASTVPRVPPRTFRQ
jgi:3-oxoacyl-[acyl-carrier protein] reductase